MWIFIFPSFECLSNIITCVFEWEKHRKREKWRKKKRDITKWIVVLNYRNSSFEIRIYSTHTEFVWMNFSPIFSCSTFKFIFSVFLLFNLYFSLCCHFILHPCFPCVSQTSCKRPNSIREKKAKERRSRRRKRKEKHYKIDCAQ